MNAKATNPTADLLAWCDEVEQRHWETTGWEDEEHVHLRNAQICNRCSVLWPCDAALTASRLRLAVKALEKIEDAPYWNGDAVCGIAREALTAMRQEGE